MDGILFRSSLLLLLSMHHAKALVTSVAKKMARDESLDHAACNRPCITLQFPARHKEICSN